MQAFAGLLLLLLALWFIGVVNLFKMIGTLLLYGLIIVLVNIMLGEK